MPPRAETTYRSAEIREKPYKLFDGGGLYLHVMPNGSRVWRIAYRHDGAPQQSLTVGAYPAVTLKEARAARDAAKKLLAQGLNPLTERQRERAFARQARENTFAAIANECLEKWKAEGEAPATIAKKEWLLKFAIDKLGRRPIAEITPPELLEVLKDVESRGHFETATRIRSTVGSVFRYAIWTGRAERDISADLRKALVNPQVKHHAAITDPKKIGALLRAIDGFEGHPTTTIALKLAPLLFVRPGELRMAEWAEIDRRDRMFRIAAHKTKLRREHLVPLSKQAMALIEELAEYSGESRYLFPSMRSKNRPMSENTLNAALRRLGYSKDEMTAHGFRTMASTRLNETGKFTPDAIERQLAHQESNEVRRAYNAAEYLPERIRMMKYWADYLDARRQQ